MSQIKVRAGQVWRINVTGTDFVVEEINKYDVIWKCNSYTPLDELHENFIFIPQNDLERAAMTSEFPEDHNFCYFSNHIDNKLKFSKAKFKQAIPRYQWQNMRHYLGLDKKPHYKLIDKEWIKQ